MMAMLTCIATKYRYETLSIPLVKLVQINTNIELNKKPSNITCECACSRFLKLKAKDIEPVYAKRNTKPTRAPVTPNNKGNTQSFLGNIFYKTKTLNKVQRLEIIME